VFLRMISNHCWLKKPAMSNLQCSLPTPAPEAARALAGIQTIAIVGLSPKPTRPSHQIGVYLKAKGYTIIPIRPAIQKLLEEPVYPSLAAYGKPVDVVNIFRRAEAVPELVDEAIRIGCKVIWMQEGICHEHAAEKARQAGIAVVQNKCIMKVMESLA